MKRLKDTIQYWSSLHQIVGKASEDVNLPNKNIIIKDLLKFLSEKHGKNFENSILDQNGEIRPSIMVLLNGASIKELNTLIVSNSKISLVILSVASGGQQALNLIF